VSDVPVGGLYVPLGLVGASGAAVEVVAHRRDNHHFSWPGLFCSAAAVLAVLGHYLLSLVRGAPQRRERTVP
jgi:hypothetical protein